MANKLNFQDRCRIIMTAAHQRADRVARRYRYAQGEFPEIAAFVQRHRRYAERAWMVFILTEGVIQPSPIVGDRAHQLYGEA